jgi:hypothetical protein
VTTRRAFEIIATTQGAVPPRRRKTLRSAPPRRKRIPATAEREIMERNLADKLSYFIKPDGTVLPVMPDQDPTFNTRELHDFIGEKIELVCYTRDGYALFRNSEGRSEGLSVNETATSLCREEKGPEEIVAGNALLAHPEHI